MSQHARHTATRPPRRPPWWRRTARGLRQIVVLTLLAAIVVALGTTVSTLPPERRAADAATGEGQRPRVEEHVELVAERVAQETPEALPDAIARALERHPHLIGPPERTEPWFEALPSPVSTDSPDGDEEAAPLPEVLELATRETLTRALNVTVDPEARDATGTAVPAERLRTLVAVGLEQWQALAHVDPDAAAAVREDLLAADAQPDDVGTADERACGALEQAAATAYELAYLYEYTAVRTGTDRDDDDADGTWRWRAAAARATTGDHLAALLPTGCTALRSPAYPAPADSALADRASALEGRWALELREAAAAVHPAARAALMEQALTAAGETWVGFARAEFD
ncbi:hypothetical protein [Zhihengliuella flava]|uniref:Uncharacterized protein n=1 Tax=Zhihengliuella flava TaxID=1285193 RepID=A0A931GDU6_9MICC|nr:hypothetical protein [Zhihengliuella flava]MBG6083808.1 hypothetical protein [Zhihengliuella flava]